jgi:hypothetical protein
MTIRCSSLEAPTEDILSYSPILACLQYARAWQLPVGSVITATRGDGSNVEYTVTHLDETSCEVSSLVGG